jgi:hypothetical protein
LGAFLARKLLQVEVRSGSKKIMPAEAITEMKRQAIEAEEAEDTEELNAGRCIPAAEYEIGYHRLKAV